MIESNGKRVIGFTEMKQKYLQHRYPIIMLDRITDYRPGEYIEAIKCVTGNSPELVGHFRERAIMPATSIVQAFAQLAVVFFKLSTEPMREDIRLRDLASFCVSPESASVRRHLGTSIVVPATS